MCSSKAYKSRVGFAILPKDMTAWHLTPQLIKLVLMSKQFNFSIINLSLYASLQALLGIHNSENDIMMSKFKCTCISFWMHIKSFYHLWLLSIHVTRFVLFAIIKTSHIKQNLCEGWKDEEPTTSIPPKSHTEIHLMIFGG